MDYQTQLSSINWKMKRLEILTRDKHRCQNCLNKNVVMGSVVGYFSRFPLNSKTVVSIRSFDDKRTFARGRISKEVLELLKSDCILYIKRNRTRREVFAIRNSTSREQEVFIAYKKKMRDLFQSGDPQYVGKRAHLDNEKRTILKNLNENHQIKDLDWLVFKGLHIHHKYYKDGLMAWEYENDALVTLCEDCHTEEHQNNCIPVYDAQGKFVGAYSNCKRCHGKGIFPEYSHVQSGLCFRCSGAKYEELI